MHTHTYTHARTQTHTHMHAYTHTHTHTYRRTQTHTHTGKQRVSSRAARCSPTEVRPNQHKHNTHIELIDRIWAIQLIHCNTLFIQCKRAFSYTILHTNTNTLNAKTSYFNCCDM